MMRRSLGLFVGSLCVLCGSLSFLCLIPSAHAADGDTVEAAPVEAATVEHIRAAIEAETDPELKAVMQEQLTLVETGELDLRASTEHNLSFGAPSGSSGELTGGRLQGATPLPMPVVDAGGGTVGSSGGRHTGGGEYLPPEARKEFEELFKQGTGDPNSEKDQELREKAHEILEKYGIDPREMGAGSEGREGGKGEYGRESSHEFGSEGLERGGGFERAFEQMAPEAREQMERLFEQGEHSGSGRETSERSFEAAERGGRETSGREHEASSREHEATTREYEAPTREHEAVSREYEAPTREYEAATREYEAPTHEYEAPERTYEAPQPYEGAPH